MRSPRPQELRAAAATLRQRVLLLPEEFSGRNCIRPLRHAVFTDARIASILPGTGRERVALTEGYVNACSYSLWGGKRKDAVT